MLERILVPLDGSELAEAILGRLKALLRRKDAEVVLARAIYVETSLARTDTTRALARQREEAETYLERILRRLVDEGIRARKVVVEGPPEEALLEAAREADLIALSTHGRSGVPRFIFGSVAEKILRASPIPVLISRSFESAAEIPFRKILVPTDESDAARAVLPAALEFARLFGSEVVVLRVEAEAPVPVGAYSGRLDADGKTAELLAQGGVPVSTLQLSGDPASQIVDLCRPHGIDLIAMSTHGRSGVGRWVLGSVTEKVVRAAPVPVLVVRSR